MKNLLLAAVVAGTASQATSTTTAPRTTPASSGRACEPSALLTPSGTLYSPRRALQALTFDRRDGLVLRAMDPIEREE